MNYDAFRRQWEAALREAGLLTHLDDAEESVALATMSRKYVLRAGAFQNQPAEPFTGSIELRWEWDALLAARARTTENDLLTTLLGRDTISPTDTVRPWLRIDIALHGKLAWGAPPTPVGREAWRSWVTEVTAQVDPLLPPSDNDSGRDGAVHSWLGEPEAQLRCGSAGELWLLGVTLKGWQAVDLPRQWDGETTADEDPEEQLTMLAARLAEALGAWKRSLRLLLPKSSRLH